MRASGQFYAFYVVVVVAMVRLGQAEEAKPVGADRARKAVERGLIFLRDDAAKWREAKQCSTCHHGVMTVWAQMEAQSRGFAVEPEVVAETVQWTKDRLLERIDLERDTRPGWAMVNTSALYMAVMAQAIPTQNAMTPDDLKRIAQHLLRHQEPDGSWAWSSAPPVNRPPPLFESDEVATRLGFMALTPHVPADPNQPSAIRDGQTKAAAWLKQLKSSDSTQEALLTLLMKVQAKAPADEVQTDIAKLLKRQNADGGWGQLRERESDAYATGQILYGLNLAGVSSQTDAIQRGITYLVDRQQEDGSWSMNRRGHPGVTPSDFKIPIIYLGSAWATIGLARNSSPVVTP